MADHRGATVDTGRHGGNRGLADGRAIKPPADVLSSLVCLSQDWDSGWLPYWAGCLGMKPAYHRKLWEFAYIAQVLSEAGLLRVGTQGLGFGCGKEPLASLFAHAGSDVVATDLEAADSRAKVWSGGEQHANAVKDIWMPDLCSREEAAAHPLARPLQLRARIDPSRCARPARGLR